MLRVGVLVSGGGTNLQAIIDAVNTGMITNTSIEIVISNNPNAYALTRAKENNIDNLCISPKTFEKREDFNKALIKKLDEYQLDLIVLAGCMVVLPAELIDKYENRIINIHPALIPSFCGTGYYGLHVHEDHFFPEIIAPDTLEPVAPGEVGELVFTTLTKEGLPMIRYRTKDLTSITYDKCECGRTTARISRFKGRSDDMLVIRGVNVFPSQIEGVLMQKAVEVKWGDTPEILQRRVIEEAEWKIMPEAINLIANGKVQVIDGKVKIQE